MKPPPVNPLPIYIRWMIRRDMPEVMDIEQRSFDSPWRKDDFIKVLRQRNCIGMVAEFDESVVGYMVYELHKKKLEILNIAVDIEFRHLEVGRQMIEKLSSKLRKDRRQRIDLVVSDRNLDAQLFFKACGFKAVSVLDDYYDSGDAYFMRLKVGELLAPESRTTEPKGVKTMSKANKPELVLPVKFMTVSIGVTTARLGVTVEREWLNINKADDSLCDRRLIGRVVLGSLDTSRQAGMFEDVERELAGAFDVKGFRVTKKSITFALTFVRESIHVEELAEFSGASGGLIVDEIGAIEAEKSNEEQEAA